MKKNFFIAISLFFLPSFVFAFTFSQNLKLGDSNQDVLELQKVLNNNSDTKIADYGAGSPSNETNYFGLLTRNAVIRFQNKYNGEILTPNGLFYGTGFVGQSTINKLNQLLSQNIKSNTPKTEKATISSLILNTNQIKNLTETDSILPYFPSKYEVFSGDKISISGLGFSLENNTVYFGNDYSVSGLSAKDTTSLTFNIPKDLPLGRYDVRVGNGNNISKHSTFLIVVDKNSKRPVIKSVTPTSGGYGTTVTITGDNFTKTGNEIRSSYAVIPNIDSSDGQTLVLKVSPFPEQLQNTKPQKSYNWNINFRVINDGGLSTSAGLFIMEVK